MLKIIVIEWPLELENYSAFDLKHNLYVECTIARKSIEKKIHFHFPRNNNH